MSREWDTANELLRLNLTPGARRRILMAEEGLTVEQAEVLLDVAERDITEARLTRDATRPRPKPGQIAVFGIGERSVV
jgi:hypothetical protein